MTKMAYALPVVLGLAALASQPAAQTALPRAESSVSVVNGQLAWGKLVLGMSVTEVENVLAESLVLKAVVDPYMPCPGREAAVETQKQRVTVTFGAPDAGGRLIGIHVPFLSQRALKEVASGLRAQVPDLRYESRGGSESLDTLPLYVLQQDKQQGVLVDAGKGLWISRGCWPRPVTWVIDDAAIQVLPGRIEGKVVDASGGVLPGVTVTIGGQEPPRLAGTSSRGTYLVDGVPPGKYEVEAWLAGFDKISVLNVEIKPGQTALLNFTMVTVPRPEPLPRLRAHVERMTGPGAVDCGQHFLRQVGRGSFTSASAATIRTSIECGLAARRQGKNFWTFVQLQGIDSWVATGLLSQDGLVFQFMFDDDPSGGSGGPAKFTLERCVSPGVVTTRGESRFTCIERKLQSTPSS